MGTYEKSSMYDYILNELANYSPLEYSEEVSLFDMVKKGDKNAREKLVKHNLRLVFSVVTRMPFVNENNFEDYFQCGTSSLLDAVDKYDASFGLKFSTYAFKSIFHGIRREYYLNGKTIRYPINMYERKHEVLKRIEELFEKGYTFEEISKELNMNYEYIISFLRINDVPISIYEKVREEDKCTIGDLIASKEDSPEEVVSKKFSNEKLLEIIDNSSLSYEEKEVIMSLYLNNTMENVTAASISREFGCTRQYIKNIERIAFRKIRQNRKTIELAGISGDEKEDIAALEIMRDYYKDRRRKTINGVIGVEDGKIVSLSRKADK